MQCSKVSQHTASGVLQHKNHIVCLELSRDTPVYYFPQLNSILGARVSTQTARLIFSINNQKLLDIQVSITTATSTEEHKDV